MFVELRKFVEYTVPAGETAGNLEEIDIAEITFDSQNIPCD